ncbi:hypothetical protein KAJ27_07620, partial [bacterium]|nr:hypothetical protein [bacterium]
LKFPGIPIFMVLIHSMISPVFHVPTVYFLVASALALKYNLKLSTVTGSVKHKSYLKYSALFLILFFLMYLSNYMMIRKYEKSGFSYFASGEYAKAGVEYKKCLDMMPDFGPGLLHMGMIKLKAGKDKQAFKLLEMAQQTGSDMKIYTSLSTLYYKRGDYGKALNYMFYARDHYFLDYYYEINNNLGNIFYQIGKYSQAIKHYLIAYNNPGKNYDTITYNIGLTYEKIGLGKKAFEYYEKLYKFSGLKNSTKFLLKLARYRCKYKKYHEAVILYKYVLKKVSNNFPVMLELADLLMILGNKSGAYLYYISIKNMSKDSVLIKKAENGLKKISVK